MGSLADGDAMDVDMEAEVAAAPPVFMNGKMQEAIEGVSTNASVVLVTGAAGGEMGLLRRLTGLQWTWTWRLRWQLRPRKPG